MSIQVTIQATDPSQLRAALKAILQDLASSTAVIEQPMVEVPVEPKATRKKAEPKVEAPKEPEKPALTIEDLRAKLKKLGEAKDHDTVFDLLKKHGAQKASEVKPELYAVVIADIDAVLAAE